MDIVLRRTSIIIWCVQWNERSGGIQCEMNANYIGYFCKWYWVNDDHSGDEHFASESYTIAQVFDTPESLTARYHTLFIIWLAAK